MTTHRYPVVVWRDHAGLFTAYLLRPEGAVTAFGRGEQEVLRLARELVVWEARSGRPLVAPDYDELALVHVKAEVRPEYRVRERPQPCRESVTLLLPCLTCRTTNDLLLAVLPTLDASFAYSEGQGLRELVGHHVRQELRGLTPRALSRFLPPAEVLLRSQAVVLKARAAPRRQGAELLASVAEPLAGRELARRFPRAWGRDELTRDLTERLAGERASVLLVGEPGAGKTTLLVGAAREAEQRWANEHPDAPPEPRFWLTSAARLIAGMRFLGQWEERCEAVLAELQRIDGVLVLGDLLEAVRAGGRTAQDGVAAFLLPYLQSGELRLVAETTPAQLDACRRLLPGLVERLQVLVVPTFDRATTRALLARLGQGLSQETRVAIEPGAVLAVERLFARFLPYQAPPGPAASFLRERFDEAARAARARIDDDEVLQAFVRRTGISELFLRDELLLDAATVRAELDRLVIGQPAACQAVTDAVLAFKAGLNDPERPVAVWLFCGPTGVGKTALARALARFLFGHGAEKDRLLRFDMSELSGPFAAERLLGDGTGADDLIAQVRRQPFSVVLLDEIEKAAPEVLDVLLGLFDEGRLTDRNGRTTWFRSAIVIMTSNLGAGSEQAIGFSEEASGTHEDAALRFFRPELFNRLDAVVTFHPLEPESVRRIARKELEDLAAREGFLRAGLRLTWSDALVAYLARAGFDARYGARPLQRTLEALVVTPLARLLVEQPAIAGKTVRVDVDAGGQVAIEVV